MTSLPRVVLPLRILLVLVFAAVTAAQIWAVPEVLPDIAVTAQGIKLSIP